MRDYLPINSNLTNESINDNYIEFVLNSNQHELIYCNYFGSEIKIVKSDGSVLDDNVKLYIIDGFCQIILSDCTIILNDVPCELN